MKLKALHNTAVLLSTGEASTGRLWPLLEIYLERPGPTGENLEEESGKTVGKYDLWAAMCVCKK